mmetsp:Transcript_43292/g.68581  ORF Transcript_43292/g.68581 Transcript_43292/m.68581 type:complete len:212 (-) Transcript_43292:1619-2254(-)
MEETDKDVALTLEHRVLVVFGRHVCQLLHGLPELRLGQGRRRQGVLQHRGGVLLQAALSHLGAGEVAADHLSLHCEPQVSVLQGPCGLRQHDEMWWPTTTTNGSTATMEESDVHAMLFPHLQQVLHGTVKFPGRCKLSSILHAVGVAQHHLLLPLDVVSVPWDTQNSVHHLWRIDEVLSCLKQRSHPHELLHSSQFLQQTHSEDIRGRPCH